MAGDGTSQVNTRGTAAGSRGDHFYKKSVAANTDAAYAFSQTARILMQEKSADDIYAVAGQLKRKKVQGYYYHAGEITKKGLKGISRCI